MAVTIKKPKTLRPVTPDPALMQIDSAMLRRCHLLALTGLSETTLERRIARGDFPPPDDYECRRPLWRVSTYKAWASMTPVERAKLHVARLEAAGKPTGLAKAHITNSHRLK